MHLKICVFLRTESSGEGIPILRLEGSFFVCVEDRTWRI